MINSTQIFKNLERKCLAEAIRKISSAKTRKSANEAFTLWKTIFQKNKAFIAVIIEKKKDFEENGDLIEKIKNKYK